MKSKTFDDHYKELAREMYNNINGYMKTKNNDEETNKEREGIIDALAIIIEEICINEGLNYSDIKYISHGATSYIYQIGDKILKLGDGRYSKTIPKNPYILQPILRREFAADGGNKERLFIEIVERVEILEESEITEEELYKLYASLRNMGIEWCDISYQNVGRLIKDNVIHWNNDINPA